MFKYYFFTSKLIFPQLPIRGQGNWWRSSSLLSITVFMLKLKRILQNTNPIFLSLDPSWNSCILCHCVRLIGIHSNNVEIPLAFNSWQSCITLFPSISTYSILEILFLIFSWLKYPSVFFLHFFVNSATSSTSSPWLEFDLFLAFTE